MVQPNPMTDPSQALLVNRIIWAAMGLGMLIFGGVALAIAPPAGEGAADDLGPLLFYIACAMVVAAIPAGLFVRGQVFKRGWAGDVITPQAYTTGNIIAWACCEGPAFFALIAMFLSDRVVPDILPAVAAFVMHLLLWPNGRAMFSSNQVEDPYPVVTERK